MPTLLLMRGARYARRIRLSDGEVRLGRWSGNEIVLPSQLVSKVHAVLKCHGDFVTVHDMRSTNGCFVNGQRIDTSPLLDGDRLRLADMELMYCRQDDPEAEIAPTRMASALDDAMATDLISLAPKEEPARRAAPARPRSRGQPVAEGIAFTLPMRGREISALITYDALALHFGVYAIGDGGYDRAVDVYEANTLAIHVAATCKYQQQAQEPVVLRARNF
ncbi:FHA domain-containing protein [Variovorax sp. KK3]|uniref:FHA domain-containing protein n=1 Tax=Variovorax sp. KK3 TaxID=1855728 RepID=UPI00097C62EB|nr:FHA domain-containing protein [Variovorax sp. KK3]